MTATSTMRPPPDVTEIGIGGVLDFRQRLARNPDKRCRVVRAAHDGRHLPRCRARLELGVNRLENAAIERDQVRYERHRRAELLLDFGLMPVAEETVGRHTAVILGEVRALAGLLARARDA